MVQNKNTASDTKHSLQPHQANGQVDGRSMLCPICKKVLAEQHSGLLACVDGHGTLITGKYLRDIEESPHIDEVSSTSSVDSTQQILCPNCSTPMQKVDFNSTHVTIDTCTNCHYRWLDAGEITKIKHHKSAIVAQDLLFIADVDKQIRQANRLEIKEANPRLPLQGSYRAGAEAVAGISGRQEVRLGAIIGQGFYGILRGLTHSKMSRWLMIITLLIFGLIAFLLYIDAKHSFGL